MNFRLGAIWAFVSVDQDGDEGLIGMATSSGWMPFVCGDEKRLVQLRPIAQDIAQRTGTMVRLVRFDQRHDVEVIGGGG